ncbi:MAG: ABC transporter permease [Gemmatimonadaceae bacterium]
MITPRNEAPNDRAEQKSDPPAVVWWFLAHALASRIREPMLGDIEEQYRQMHAERGAYSANRWLLRETLCAPLTRLQRASISPQLHKFTGDSHMTTLQSDLQFAWRMLVRRPAFTLLAVFTLALGIGATTAIFSVVYPILFESLPYPNADRVMMVWEGSDPTDKSNLGYATYADILEKNRTFSDVAVVAYASGTMTGRSEPQFLEGDRVSASFFKVLGVNPALGRAFRDADNVRGSERVIIISNALWRSRFSGDSSIIGKPLKMMETDFTIVGVMPASFENLISPTWQFLLPIRYDLSLPQACRSCRHLRVVARRKEGVTTAQAQRDLAGIAQELKRDYPKDYRYSGLHTNALSEDVVKNVRPALLAVLGAVALVLLVACLNVMNLLLARGAQREGEFAVRAALGAGRSRLVRQLLSESVLLAFLGGIAGIAVAYGGVRILVALSPADLPRLSEIGIQGSVLLFALVTTTVVGVAFGVIPAMQGSRSNLHDSIRRNTRRSAATSRLTRSTLVISEVALALVLLVGSGLLFRSMEKLFSVNPGFDSQNLLTMQIQGGGGKLTNDTLVLQFMEDALQSVRAQPGVLSAALTSQLPLTDDRDEYGVQFETRPPLNPNDANGGRYRFAVSDGYFETMKIPLVRGRYFATTDKGTSTLVAIINQSFARRYFGEVSPVGQRVKIGGTDGPWREIVGVVGDVKHESLSSTHFDAVYLPEVQWRFVDYAMTLVVRPRGDAMAAVPSLRKTIWAVDKDQPIIRIATAEHLIAEREAERRFALVLFEGFAIVALVLAAAGIYGVLSGTVSERGRELGVRAALGATGRDQIAMVVRQGMTLTTIGMIVGLGVSLASSRILSSMLFGISPLDPTTYVGVTGGLVCVALLACWIPARRASQTSPLEALKAD